MDALLESFRDEWQTLLDFMPRAALAALVLLAAWWIGRVVGRGVLRLLERGWMAELERRFLARAVRWIIYLMGVAVTLNALGLDAAATGLLAGGGLTAVVLGFAFRQIGENFLAGVLLAFNRPFQVGDLIESGDFQGVVRTIDLRQTHIRSADGRDIYIPNAQIVTVPVINFTRDGLLRPSFVVGIDYADDAGRACELLRQTLAPIPGVLSDPPPLVGVKALASSYVELELSFWIDTFKAGVNLPGVRSAALEACRRALIGEGFTVSSEVSTTLALTGRSPLEVRVE